MERFDVNQYCSFGNHRGKRGCLEQGCQLFLGKNWSEIGWVCLGKAHIPSFGVDVPALGKCVRLGPELSWSELNEEIEGAEVFGPADLSPR